MGFTANGTVDSFDASSFTENLAAYLSVTPSMLQVTVEAGSVVISVVLIAPAESVAVEATRRVRVLAAQPATAEAALGVAVAVDTVSEPEVVTYYPPSGGGGGGAIIAIVVVLLLLGGAGYYYHKNGAPAWWQERRRKAHQQQITVGLGQAIQQGIIDQQMQNKVKMKRASRSGSGIFRTGPPVDAIETVVLTSTHQSCTPAPPAGPPPPVPARPPRPPSAPPPTGPPPGPPPNYSLEELAANQA